MSDITAQDNYCSQYLFLRKIWNMNYLKEDQISSQDRLDKLNKVVAMIRQRILTNTIKQSNKLITKPNHHIQSPITQNQQLQSYQKLKTQLQCAMMSKQALYQQLYHTKLLYIQSINNSKLLQQQKQQLVNKNKDITQLLMQISQRNITLNHQMLDKVIHKRSHSYCQQLMTSQIKHIPSIQQVRQMRYISETKKNKNQSFNQSNVFYELNLNDQNNQNPRLFDSRKNKALSVHSKITNQQTNNCNVYHIKQKIKHLLEINYNRVV